MTRTRGTGMVIKSLADLIGNPTKNDSQRSKNRRRALSTFSLKYLERLAFIGARCTWEEKLWKAEVP